MNKEVLKQRIQQQIITTELEILGEGCNLSCYVVSSDFIGKPLLSRQRMILKLVDEEIKNGTLHALSIKAKTPDEANQR